MRLRLPLLVLRTLRPLKIPRTRDGRHAACSPAAPPTTTALLFLVARLAGLRRSLLLRAAGVQLLLLLLLLLLNDATGCRNFQRRRGRRRVEECRGL